jgi:hypothetical protein
MKEQNLHAVCSVEVILTQFPPFPENIRAVRDYLSLPLPLKLALYAQIPFVNFSMVDDSAISQQFQKGLVYSAH